MAENTPFGELIDAFDAADLSRVKSDWLQGNWNALAEIDLKGLQKHPDLAIFAAFKAVGFFHLGVSHEAERYIKLTQALGGASSLMASLLVAGVYNTMGRIEALRQNEDKRKANFQQALSLVPGAEPTPDTLHERSVRELTELGLLSEASALIRKQVDSFKYEGLRPCRIQSKLTQFSTEIGLIAHQLTQAYKKQQSFVGVKERGEAGGDCVSSPGKNLPAKSPSQLGQDLWVLEQTGYKNGGFFVEFGAANGVLLSNTFLLETEFNWKGLCADPNPDFFKELKENRSCTVSDACVGGKTGQKVSFILANEYGCVEDYMDADMHAEKREAYQRTGGVVELETISLHDLLIANDAPKRIDYISIDTEGSEYDILATFPFEKWDVHCFTIEHNFTPQRKLIRELMEANGYACTECSFDDWYVRQNERQ